MSKTLTYDETLVIVSCPSCEMRYGIPQSMDERAHAYPTQMSIYCPKGHSWHYTGKSEAQKEREKRERAEAEATRLQARLDQERATNETLRRSRSALQGEVTKARKRAAATCCPVGDCHRTISPAQMQRHIATQHPTWTPEPTLADA